MKIHELTEAISVTHLSIQLKDAIKEGIEYCVAQMGYKSRTILPSIKAYVIKNVDLSPLHTEIQKNLTHMLPPILAAHIQTVLEADQGFPIEVKFVTTGSGGYADGLKLYISDRIIPKLIDPVLDYARDVTVDNLDSNDEIFDEYFATFRSVGLTWEVDRAYNTFDKLKLIESLIHIILHELVHVIQHHRQFIKNRSSTEYRSYLEKDKAKFYAIIDKIGNVDVTPDERKIYRASPQELAAFAHNTALSCISDLYVDEVTSLGELAECRKNVSEVIESRMDDMFSVKKSPVEAKVFKRMHKLIYQEVMRYIDRKEQQLKKTAGK